MEPMLEMPYDPIAKLQTVFAEDRVKHDVERNDLAIRDVIADLPAQRSARMQQAHAIRNHLCLCLHIGFEWRALLVGFADVVGRRSDDELHALVLKRAHKGKIVSAMHVSIAVS